MLEPEPFAHVENVKYEGMEFLNFGSQVPLPSEIGLG